MGWQVRGRWWNGKWGRARRDVQLSTDGQRWRAEAREGADADWWQRDYRSEREARAVVNGMLARGAERRQWRDLTEITEAGPVNRYRGGGGGH